jgi:hypothetical protein
MRALQAPALPLGYVTTAAEFSGRSPEVSNACLLENQRAPVGALDVWRIGAGDGI